MTKLAAFVVSLVAALGFMAAPVAAQDGRILTGMARVIDSDRIQIGDQIIRLFGIDAMERDQTCRAGQRRMDCWGNAVRLLQTTVDPEATTCREMGQARFGHIYAVCQTGGQDLSELLARSGWALAFTRQSEDYVAAEAAAKEAKLGVWQGRFKKPWDHRRDQGRPPDN
jgi:endonuclease YncB( thermonuclease family)